MTPSNNPLDDMEFWGGRLLKSSSQLGYGYMLSAEDKAAIEAYVEARLKAQREDIRKRLPKKKHYKSGDAPIGTQSFGFNHCLDQITKILEEQL